MISTEMQSSLPEKLLIEVIAFMGKSRLHF